MGLNLPDAPDDVSGIVAWVLGAMAAVLGTLSKIIHTMYRQEQSSNAKAIKDLETRLVSADAKIAASDRKHEECLEDRHRLSLEIATANARIASLEEKTAGQ